MTKNYIYMDVRDDPKIEGNDVPQLKSILNDAQARGLKFVPLAALLMAATTLLSEASDRFSELAHVSPVSVWLSFSAVLLLMCSAAHFPVSYMIYRNIEKTVEGWNRRFRLLLCAVELAVILGMICMVSSIGLAAYDIANFLSVADSIAN